MWKKFIEFAQSLVLLAVLLWGGYAILNLIFSSLPPWAAAATITGTIGILTLGLTSYFTQKREIELKLREEKSRVYSAFIQKWLSIIILRREKIESQEIQEFFVNFSGEIILWGSDEVVRSYSDFRRYSSQSDPNTAIVRFENLMYSMRRDLGHSNKGLQTADLISLFITDPQNLNLPTIDVRKAGA